MPAPRIDAGARRILVCQGELCRQRGGLESRRQWLAVSKNLQARVVGAACLKVCAAGPVSVVYPDGVWWGHLTGPRVPGACQALLKDQPDTVLGFLYRATWTLDHDSPGCGL